MHDATCVVSLSVMFRVPRLDLHSRTAPVCTQAAPFAYIRLSLYAKVHTSQRYYVRELPDQIHSFRLGAKRIDGFDCRCNWKGVGVTALSHAQDKHQGSGHFMGEYISISISWLIFDQRKNHR